MNNKRWIHKLPHYQISRSLNLSILLCRKEVEEKVKNNPDLLLPHSSNSVLCLFDVLKLDVCAE